MTNQPRLARLVAAGVSIWLDDLSRDQLDSGNLRRLADEWQVMGVTTNPTIFANAVRHTEAYAPVLRALAARGVTSSQAVREITVGDVRRACDVFRDIWQRSGGADGRVSLKVDPSLANESEATAAQALELWHVVDRPNLMVKIPATTAGLSAITAATGAGVSVNVTLIFSPARYAQVAQAYLAGLEQAAAQGHDLSRIRSVASFFVSRIDTEVDRRLRAAGAGESLALLGTAGIATARLAYHAFAEAHSSPRWDELAAEGAQVQRPLWASTGVKDKAYPDTRYVTELVVADTISTMPQATLAAFADHGDVHGVRVTGRALESRGLLRRLEAAGIDMDSVFELLEEEGIAKFAASWDQLHEVIAEQMAMASEHKTA
jgi:transaldolase